MSTTVLQKFLENNLLEVKPNDEEFAKLKDAATNLSKGELKRLNKVVSYTLIALDKDIPANEPLLETIKRYIQKQSPTILSKSNDPPITTYRAVALEALHTRAVNNIDYARIIWLTASHLVPFYDLKRKQGVIKKFIQDIGNLVEKSAMNQWSVNSFEDINVEQIDSASIGKVKIDVNKLENYLKGAAGPWHGDPKNPHQVHRDPTNWASIFGTMSAQGIEEVVNETFAKQNGQMKQTANDLAIQIREMHEASQDSFKQGVNSSFNRTQLLWWKEALYSKCLSASYREFNMAILPIALAVDLHHEIKGIYPVSVDYFLRETLYKVDDKATRKISFQEYFEQFASSDFSLASEILPDGAASEGRITVLKYISEGIKQNKFDPDNFYNRTGLKPNAKLIFADIAVIIFHDLQVAQLVS